MNNTVAIVVSYNRKELLKECIKRLQLQTVKTDILIVDNASNDGTDKLFEKCDDNIIYVNTGKNLGGAGGFNFGIKYAVEAGYEYLWILDDDTMAEENSLKSFFEMDNNLNGNYGFLSGKVLWKDGSICTMNIQKVSKWSKLKKFDSVSKIQYASFVSMFIKAETVKTVGLPFKEFFIWADDWEYTRRISKVNDCYFVPNSVVQHWCNSNIGADIVSVDNDRLSRFKFMYRNDVVLYRQDGIEGKLYLMIRNIYHKVKVFMSGNNVKEKLEIINNGAREGKEFIPNVEFPKGE